MALLEKKIKKNRLFTYPIVPFVFVGLMVAGILFLPLLPIETGRISLVQWCSSLMRSASLPLMGSIVVLLLERLCGWKLFSPRDWKALSMFGILCSLLLYPAALGLGPIDPYCWGWENEYFFIVFACLISLLLVLKNRFAILLILALLSFDLQWEDSTNLWDYLIDPLYAILAVIMTIRSIFLKKKAEPYPSLFVE